jgi:glucuronoarabinoxylan endo-1,4-beta-xylanase
MKLAAAVPFAHSLYAREASAGTIRWTRNAGEIDGFGASAAFHMAQNLRNFPPASREKILDLLFSQSSGAGLSIVRNIVGDGGSWGTPLNGPTPSIEPSEGTWSWAGDEDQLWFMKEAQTRGCTRFISTVWSPPAWMKDNGSVIKGRVKRDKYQAFAEYLSAYVRGYKQHHGIDIYAISPTNEPEITVDYSSCYWTAAELHDFVRDAVIPTFKRDKIEAKFLLGECSNWSEAPAVPTLEDPATAGRVDIVGTHAYLSVGKDPFPPLTSRSGILPTTQRLGKRLWQTEVSDGGPNLTGIDDGIYWAKMLHTHVVENGANAWLYWWAISNINDRGALIYLDQKQNSYVAAARLFTFGNFSRFVRPGSIRVELDAPSQPGVYLSAYKVDGGKQLVVVAINDSPDSKTVHLRLDGLRVSSMDVYRTSATEALQLLTPIPVQRDVLNLPLASSSVTTFVGSVE